MGHNGKSTAARLLTLAAIAACSLPAMAQAAWNVNDRLAQEHLKAIRDNTNSIRQYYERHGQNGRASVRLFSSVDWPEGQSLPRVAEDYGVAVACGTDGTVNASSIRGSLSRGFALPDRASVEQINTMQKEICAARQFLTNIQYNESVELVGTTLPAIKRKYEEEVLGAINANAGRGFGDAGANQVTLMAAQLEFDMAVVQFRERQGQYDRYQQLLNSYSNYLGRRAMAGRGKDAEGEGGGGGVLDSLVSATVNGSIIKAALTLGN